MPNTTNALMNDLLRRSARQRDRVGRVGLIDQLRGAGRLTEQRRERLNAAMADAEAAAKRGDDIAREIAESQIDTLVAESREAGAQHKGAESEQSSNVGQPELPTDGGAGVRGSRLAKGPSSFQQQETSAQLMRRALTARRLERAEVQSFERTFVADL